MRAAPNAFGHAPSARSAFAFSTRPSASSVKTPIATSAPASGSRSCVPPAQNPKSRNELRAPTDGNHARRPRVLHHLHRVNRLPSMQWDQVSSRRRVVVSRVRASHATKVKEMNALRSVLLGTFEASRINRRRQLAPCICCRDPDPTYLCTMGCGLVCPNCRQVVLVECTLRDGPHIYCLCAHCALDPDLVLPPCTERRCQH